MGCGDDIDTTWRNERSNPAGSGLQQRLSALQHQELLRKMDPAYGPEACPTTTRENDCVEMHTVACERETNLETHIISQACGKVNGVVEIPGGARAWDCISCPRRLYSRV